MYGAVVMKQWKNMVLEKVVLRRFYFEQSFSLSNDYVFSPFRTFSLCRIMRSQSFSNYGISSQSLMVFQNVCDSFASNNVSSGF